MSHSCPMRWHISAAFLGAVATLLLTGCETVVPAGSTGMSVDAHGDPVIVFAVCGGGHIDGATIYRDRTRTDPAGADLDTVDVANWDAAQPITAETAPHQSLQIAMPSPYWRRIGTAGALRRGVRYTAFGNTRDNTHDTGEVEFTLEQLAGLKSGEVLSQAYGETTDHGSDIIQSYEEFKHAACT